MDQRYAYGWMRYLAVGLLMVGATGALGQANPSDAPIDQDPRALKVLQDTGTYLRSLSHLHLMANSDTDQILDNGQTVQFSHRTELVATLPDKLRVSVADGPWRKTLYYNGKRFVLFDHGRRYYASGVAPASIDGLLDDMSTRYGVELPLADLFRWNVTTAVDVGLSSALYINDQEIDGHLCAHYAYRQPGVDWQLWVRLGAQPLPCQLVIIRQDDEGRPRHTVRYHWLMDKPAPASAFEFVPPANTHAVPLREITPPAQEAQP